MEKHTNDNGGCIGTLAVIAIIAIVIYILKG